MADEGRRIPYIIEMIADDHKIKQQLSKWDWEDIIGVKGKGFSDILVSDAKDAKDQITRTLGSLNLNWREILSVDDMEVFEQGLARVIQGAKREIKYFGDKKDTAGIERTMQYLTALGEEFASIGSTFDARQIARSMNSLIGVLNTLEVGAERLKSSFTTLFTKRTATSLNTIATAMASIGVEKSQITSIKRAREEMEKLAKGSTIKLDIDYGSLSPNDLLKALRDKHKSKTVDLNELLDFEWSSITMELPEITNLEARKKQLLAIIELEKRITQETGMSPVNEFFEEDTALRNMAEVKEEFNELTKAAKESSKEILNQFKQSAKDIKSAIEEEFGKLADVKVNLTLDDDNKKSFAQSVNNFVEDFNNQKYGKIEPVKIDLIPNEPDKSTNRGRPLSAAKDQIKKATTDIQKELEQAQNEYDEVNNLLNNTETGLRAKVSLDKPDDKLNRSIANAEKQLKSLEKKIISYKYLLSNMDDYEFAKHIASDWKRFASAEQVILQNQKDLLEQTKKWRSEMNNALRFKYSWKVEGTEDEYESLKSALIDLTDNNPVRLTPDIDFLAQSIEEGLASKKINVKLTADGPVNVSGVVGNLGVPPVMVVGQSPKNLSTSSFAPTTPPTTTAPTVVTTASPTQSKTNTKIYTEINSDVKAIVGFVEEQVELNKKLNLEYSELLKDAGVSDGGVAKYIEKIKKQQSQIAPEIVEKYGSAELFLQKLDKTKKQVGFNAKLPFFDAAREILKLKDAIENNPDDEDKVQEASQQIKSLLVQSVVDSFKAYSKTSKERYAQNERDIASAINAKKAAEIAYASDDEKKKRLDKINIQKKAISDLEANTAISEYELLLQLIEEARKQNDTKSLNAFLKDERDILPSVKQGYQDLIKEREKLNKLHAEDPNDKNLLAIAEAEQAIARLTKSNKKITRSRQEYEVIGFPLSKFEELVSVGNNEAIYELIVNKVLSKPDIVQSMGSRRKTSEGVDPIYLFDGIYQKLATTTVDMVQRALNIAQKATEDLNRRAENEGALNDLKKIAQRKTAVDSVRHDWGYYTPKSEADFKELSELFRDDIAHAREAENSKNATDRDRAYVRFADALDQATDAAKEFRDVQSEWSEKEQNEFKTVADKEAWMKQKYTDPEEASKNYKLYASYHTAIDALKASTDWQKDTNGNKIGDSVFGDLQSQLKGYVFRVVIVDEHGSTVTDVGTNRMVDGGKLSKPDRLLKVGSQKMAAFLANLDPSKAKDIKIYKMPGKHTGLDQPTLDTPTSSVVSKTNSDDIIRSAKQVIASHNRVVDESKNVIAAQEELESANSGLNRANAELEKTQQRMASITGGKDADEYVKSLHSKNQPPKTIVQNKINSYVKPLSNAIFDETNRAIDEETSRIARAILIDNNPLDAIKIPDVAKRMMAIINEKRALSDQPQTDTTKAQLKKLRDEESLLMTSWTQSPEAQQLMFEDIRRLDVLTEQLRKKPNDTNLQSTVEQLRNKLIQRVSLYEELLGTLPKEVYQLGDIIKQKEQIQQTLPKDIAEATSMQQQVKELSNQENLISQSVHQWKDNIAQQGQAAINSALKTQKEQGAPALAQDYQKQISELVSHAVSLSTQFATDPNNEGLKTQLQSVVNTISQLTIYYKDLLEKNKVVTQGFLGNKAQFQLETAQKILNNPLDQNLWGEFDEVPDVVKRRYELYQRNDALFKEKRDASDGRKQEIEQEMQLLAQQDKEEKQHVLSWIENLRERVGAGFFAGLDDGSGHLKAIANLRANLFGAKTEVKTADSPSDSQLPELKRLQALEATQQLAVENEKERVALAERRLVIEQELADTTITVERRAELTAEYEANRNRAAELGVKMKKFANIQVDPETLQETYINIVNAYIDKQRESDEKIALLNAEISKQYKRLGALKAQRTPEAVKEGRRHYQDATIRSAIPGLAEKLSETDPGAYAKIKQEAEDENPISNFYDHMDEYAAQAEEIAKTIKKKSEEYVRGIVANSPEKQQEIIDAAIKAQEKAIEAKEAELTTERANNSQIVANRDKYKTEGKVTDEMIAARRDVTQAIRAEAQLTERMVEETVASEASQTTPTSTPIPTSNSTSDVHYQNYASGQMYQYGEGVYGIDTSLLATEETLNAIYTLLSGDTSRSGMSDAQRKALEAEREAIRNQLKNGPLGRNGVGEAPPVKPQEAQKTAESLMTIGKAITIINKAIGESTAKTATGMAKAYANKIHGNAEAVEAAKLLYNTPDSEFTSKFGRDTKKKLLDFHGAWTNKQKAEKPKVLVEPEIAPGAVAQEVKENVTQTPAQAEVHQTTSYGGGFDGTAEEWQEVLALLNEMSAAEDAQPTAKSGDLIRARWNEVSGDFTKAQYDELVATFGEPLEKMVIASEKQVENEQKKEQASAQQVEASNQQLQNEQAKKEETTEQLQNEQAESNIQIANTEALKAREAEIDAQLEADDRLKAAKSSDNTSSGGLIGAINELAKENTLVKVLQAIGEVAKRQVASVSGKGNSAQDLLLRVQKMLEMSVEQKKERVAYIDLATGSMTDSIEGTNTGVDPATFEALRNIYKGYINFDAQVHTHADIDDPYFSQADLQQFIKDAAVGLGTQILASRNGLTVLDVKGVQDVDGLLNALMATEQNFEALSNTAAQFGATYLHSSFDSITPQGLVKLFGIKGIESKYTEEETRESAVKGMLAEDAKVAADMLQESTGRAVKRTVERVGAELMTTTEKIDAKGNKTWSKQISDKYTKAAWATNDAFAKLGLDKEFGVGTDAQLALTEYTNRYAEFVQLTEEFKKNPNKEGLQTQFNELLPKLDEAEEKLNKLILTKDKFLGNKKAIDFFDSNQVANAGDNLKALATQRYAQGGIGLGENIAFNGISDTQFGTRLLVDVLKNGVISQYALEVDKATGNVKEFAIHEASLANAFQNVNKAMKYNETVMAKVAIGNNPTQQEAFMNSAKSPEWNAYKKALATMEKYVANIWNRMAQGGRGASQKELDYIMTLSENVLELGKNVSKTSGEFKTFWDQNPSDVTALNIKIKKRGKNVLSRDEQVRAEMERLAQTKASASGQRYAFSSFDNDTLKYKLTDLSGNIRNVTMVWSELYGQVATISDKSIAEVDTLAGKVEKLKGKFEEAESVGYLNDKNKDLMAFKKQLEDIDNAVKNGDTFENIEAMRQKAIALGDRITKVVNQTKGMMVGTGAKKSVDNQYDKIMGTMQGLPDELRPDFGSKNNAQVVQQYIDAYKQLNKDYQKYVDNNKINSPKIQQQLKQQAVHVQMLGKKLLSSATQASKLNDLVEQSGFYVDKNTGEERNLGGITSVTEQELLNLEDKMRDYVQKLGQANIEGAKFDSVNQKMTYTFRTSKDTVADMVVQYNKATKSLYAYQKQERESLTGLAGFLQTMKVKTRSILQYVTSMTSIYRVWGMLRQGVQYIKEIDAALVELRKVTNETEATYDRFLQTASQTAGKLGSTISAVTEATATFAKLGYSMQMASEMAEAAIVYKNVGDNISSTEDAADSIISTLKGFGLEASETMRIVDRFNEVGNKFAITSQGIGEALKLSASALNEGGNTLDESIGIITAANEVVNDPSSVGTALKTLTLRLRGSKTELEEMGEDVSDMATTTSSLQAKLLALTGGKVDIMLDTNTFKSTTQILREMSEAWEDMTDIERASALELMGGKRQANTLSALIQNFDTAERAIEASAKSSGSALHENEVYLDSIQGRIDLLNNSVQTLWNNALNADAVKIIVDVGTGLVKIVDQLGLVKTLIFGIGTYLIQKHWKGDLMDGLFGGNIEDAKHKLKLVEDKITKLQSKKSTSFNQKRITKLQDTKTETEKYIQEYDELSEKLKKYKTESDGAKKALDNFNKKLANKAAKGKKITDNDIVQQSKLNAKYDEANTKVQQTETELAKVEMQANMTGTAGLTAGQKIKTGFISATKSVWQFGKQMLKSMAWSMAFTAIFEAFSNTLSLFKKGWDKFHPATTLEELEDALEETKNELSNLESEIDSLNSELEDTNERIDELLHQGNLSYVEQEELAKLQAVTSELEAQIKLQETLKKSLQTTANNQAIAATNSYLDTSFMSNKTKSERQEEAKETGGQIGQIAGTIIGGIVGTIIGGGITLASGGTAAVPGAAIGIAAGSAIVGWLGGEVGSAKAGASYDSEQTVAEAMDNMMAERQKLKDIQNKALADSDAEAYNEATEALATYDKQLATHIQKIQENYNAMDWVTAEPEQKQYMKDMADWLSNYNITMGTTGAKSNSIDRIFGKEADTKLQDIKKKIEEAAKKGEDFELKEILTEEEYQTVLHRLARLEVGIGDVVAYFEDTQSAANDALENISTLDALKEIKNLTEGVNQLKNAFDELHESGSVSVDTLLSLADVFGETEGFDTLLNMMSTGVYSIEEMTGQAEIVAENYINSKISSAGMSTSDYLTHLSSLTNLNVSNAREFLQAKLVQAAADAYVDGTYKTIEEASAAFSNKIFTVDLPPEIVAAAKVAKEAGDNASKQQSDYKLYQKQITEQSNAQGDVDTYNSHLAFLDKMGVHTESIVNAFGNSVMDAQEVFHATMTSNVPEEFATLYNNAKEAYQDGNTAVLNQTLSELSKYGVYTEKISNAFDADFDAATIWGHREMTSDFEHAYNEAKRLYEKGLEIPEVTAPKMSEQDVQDAKDAAQKAAEAYQKELDKIGLKIKMEIVDASASVDEIQSIFDTLASAQKEYEDNGYFTVDTVQNLLALEPKYLDLLVDENGQINLNKEALYNVAIARLTDMKLKQQDAILLEAEKLAIAGTADVLNAQVGVMYGVAEAYDVLIAARLANIKAILLERQAEGDLEGFDVDSYVSGLKGQLDAVENVTNSAIVNIENSLSSAGNTAKDELIDAFKKEMDYWENQINAQQAKYEQVQNEIDLFEKQGKRAGAEYYQEQIKLEEQRRDLLEQQKDAAKDFLGQFDEGSEDWWEVANVLNDIESELDDVTASIQDLRDAIAQIHWDNLEEFGERVSNLHTELSDIRDVLSSEDMFNEQGEWTEAGVATLGTYIQEIEMYKNELKEIEDELNDFGRGYQGNEDYFKTTWGIDSEQEYYDKLTELNELQREYTKGIHESEQSVVEMYENQIDAIEDYTSELVDSYNDYIDVVKEALDAERDLYEFKKNVKKQTKDIATLERRIAALTGSNSAADIAERRKLEAELYEAKEDLNDTYYDHAKDQQDQALDDESEAYAESMENYIEKLRDTLTEAQLNMDSFMQQVTTTVMLNAGVIEQKYNETGLAISEDLTSPWQKAYEAMKGYEINGLALMNAWTTAGGFFDTFDIQATGYLKSPWDAGKTAVSSFQSAVSSALKSVVSDVASNVATAKGELADLYAEIVSTQARIDEVKASSYQPEPEPEPEPKPSKYLTSETEYIHEDGQWIAGSGEEYVRISENRFVAASTISASDDVIPEGTYWYTADELHLDYIAPRSTTSKVTPKNDKKKPTITVQQTYDDPYSKLQYQKYASGTTGTTKDQWAITDEPWLGDELVLVPTAQGNLSYMRKGTAVMPADISENLMEWGKLNPNMMNVNGVGANINMINNAVSKPEFKFDIENFLRCDNVSQDTMPELKKFVNEQMNSFMRQLNYGLKKSGAR